MLEALLLIVLKTAIAALNLLPVVLRVWLISSILRVFLFLVPKHKRIAEKNLVLAFPEKDGAWRSKIISDSIQSLARLLVDFARLHTLDETWVRSHIECPLLETYERMKKENPGKGILLATGHLGSFELLAHCMPMYGWPISFVVRNFKMPRIDAWWTANREAYGNKVISRKGAFRELERVLQEGRDVALLFDQNVTRNHAVFVEWFGKPAATTRALALAALRAEAQVIVASIKFLGDDRYRIEAKQCDFTALYQDATLSTDEKVFKITAEISKEYEQMIRQYPEGWFWMHRRWKTAPEGVAEDFYSRV